MAEWRGQARVSAPNATAADRPEQDNPPDARQAASDDRLAEMKRNLRQDLFLSLGEGRQRRGFLLNGKPAEPTAQLVAGVSLVAVPGEP